MQNFYNKNMNFQTVTENNSYKLHRLERDAQDHMKSIKIQSLVMQDLSFKNVLLGNENSIIIKNIFS
jgi:hypothetical protein